MASRTTWTERLLFAGVVLAWGGNYLFVRAGLSVSPPLWLASLRAGVGVLGLLVLFAIPGQTGRLDLRGKRDALLLGIPTTGLFFGSWFLAAGEVLPGIAAVTIYTFPLWVALFSVVLGGAPLGPKHWVAVAIGFGGVALIAQPWQSTAGSGLLLPLAELLLGAIAWAVGTVGFQRRFSGDVSSEANLYQMAGGTGTLVIGAAIWEHSTFPAASIELALLVLWLGLFGSAFAYAAWYFLLARHRAATLSAYLFLVPVVALAASAIVFGERLNGVQAAGVLGVLASVYLVGARRLGAGPKPSEGR